MKNLGTFKDTDGTIKKVFSVEPNNIIEMTFISNKPDVDVVCVPSHHFCSLGCKMCHLTNKGLNKQMHAIAKKDFLEALFRTTHIIYSYGVTNTKRTTNNKLLISFMGVGEPLLNLKLLQEVFSEINYLKEYLGYEYVSFALSTMMPNNSIDELANYINDNNIPLKIHFSLHSPFDNERFDLLPSTIVGVREALDYLEKYRCCIRENEYIRTQMKMFHECSQPIEIHYTLIKSINDSDAHLNHLIELERKYQIPIKFISFNPVGNMERSLNTDIWLRRLHEEVPNLRVVTYSPPGKQIGSSCGEFTKHYYHYEIETEKEKEEFLRWEKKYRIIEEHDGT